MMEQRPHIQELRPEDLLIDLQNPRYDPRNSQREALQTMVNEQGSKLVNLADDIVTKGLDPSVLPLVTPAGDGKRFIVLEGNRRIAALKLLASRSLRTSLTLSSGLSRRLRDISENAADLPETIPCVVTSREDANHWILLRHTGENGGVGVIAWDGKATHRFRGSSPALQAIEMVDKGNFLDDEIRALLPKIAITNIERILGTPAARALLGVDVKDGVLSLVAMRDEALGRLASVVIDVARRAIRVTDLDSKEQRIGYARDVAGRPLAKPLQEGAHGKKTAADDSSRSAARPRRVSTERRTLIPRGCSLSIRQSRINKIYGELLKLDVHRFVNSCAVLLRVFVEMCTEDYARRHGISLRSSGKPILGGGPPGPAKELSLRKKLIAVSDHLENTKACDKQELYGIRAAIRGQDYLLSVENWHAYVHNLHYSPSPDDLKTCWDSIEAFIRGLCAP